MKRIILFSTPDDNPNLDLITDLIFPTEIVQKKPIFMPAHGVKNTATLYIDQWKKISDKYNLDLNILDNSSTDKEKEAFKLLNSNILIISGGDTFRLLMNLRKSGLDKVIKDFIKKDEFIIAGYSAGAYVLTPSIRFCRAIQDYGQKRKIDEEEIELNDLSGLGIVNFEIFAHYSKNHHQHLLQVFRNKSNFGIKEITNDGYIVIDL